MLRGIFLTSVLALAIPSVAGPVEGIGLFDGTWPRAFFFRAAEGMAANPRVAYDQWERSFSRLQGIEGKVLDEEIPGRSRRNVEFFRRFKRTHPRQLVLLHYNGNARDPRDAKGKFFAGHWVYHTGCKLTADVVAEEGVSELGVEDAGLFKTGMGRYGDKNEDIGLCTLDERGHPDWARSEQVQLIEVDKARNVLKVRRGCFGSEPGGFAAGQAYAAAHVTEGPWGKRSNLMWMYNFSTHCPRNAQGKSCVDVLVDDLVAEFSASGRLHGFDGVEFDVLSHQRWAPLRTGRGIDTNGDGKHDGGFIEGVNEYGVGVYEFCRGLRDRLGDDVLMLADGHGPNHQRAFGQLNGIESEGWPSLMDWEMADWSGGLNRHLYWARFGRKPVFNYFNHKYIDGKEGVLPDVPFSTHRLSMAAAQFVDAAVTYSFAPPREPGGLFPIWDELWNGRQRQLGWLGRPLGPPVRLGLEQPDMLGDENRPWPGAVMGRLSGDDCRFSPAGDAIEVSSTTPSRDRLHFRLKGIPCPTADLLVAVTMRGAPRTGYPEQMPRLAWVSASAPGWLISPDDPPRTGIHLRGEEPAPLDPDTGASVRYFANRKLSGDGREAYFCHPPWRDHKTGQTFWERDVRIPSDAVLRFSIGMGELSPERSDGVVFQVLVRESDGPWEQLFTKTYNEFRWQDEQVTLERWAGKVVTLRFATDAGPQDDSTTDHAAWAQVRVLRADEPDLMPQREAAMTFVGTESFRSTFAFRRVRGQTIDLEFSIEGPQPVWLEKLTAHVAPDAIAREYEGGAVVANPSYHEVTFDMSRLFPGRKLRRIEGTAAQDPATNDGSPVGGRLRLGARDALFLAADDR